MDRNGVAGRGLVWRGIESQARRGANSVWIGKHRSERGVAGMEGIGVASRGKARNARESTGVVCNGTESLAW